MVSGRDARDCGADGTNNVSSVLVTFVSLNIEGNDVGDCPLSAPSAPSLSSAAGLRTGVPGADGKPPVACCLEEVVEVDRGTVLNSSDCAALEP
jgi:hypothetical protein